MSKVLQIELNVLFLLPGVKLQDKFSNAKHCGVNLIFWAMFDIVSRLFLDRAHA